LARIAVESGMGANQLRDIYRLSRTKPLPYIEAHVKRQMGRESVKGFIAFARILELLRKHWGNPSSFTRVLMYAVMLYDYVEKEPLMKLRMVAEPIIKRVVEAKGSSLDGISMRLYGRSLEVNVKVHRLSTSPKALADEISDSLKRKEEFSNLNLKVWIESR